VRFFASMTTMLPAAAESAVKWRPRRISSRFLQRKAFLEGACVGKQKAAPAVVPPTNRNNARITAAATATLNNVFLSLSMINPPAKWFDEFNEAEMDLDASHRSDNIQISRHHESFLVPIANPIMPY
jgi:hypothetical protein